jgi:N-methylhydantoinase B
LHITPIEILETEYPCRITRFELMADTGGAGEWRGGLSYQREYELLEDAIVTRRFDRTRFPPNGIKGAKNGSRSRFVMRVGSSGEEEVRNSGRFHMKAGERFMLQSAGGGGYGDPGQRDPEALAQDVAEGYVSHQAQLSDYCKN